MTLKYSGKFQPLAFCILFLLIIVLSNCHKMDVQTKNFTEKFFEAKNPSPTILRCIKELKRQNEITGFVEYFAIHEGLARWDKPLIQKRNKEPNSLVTNFGNSTGDTLVFIPLVVEDGLSVNGYLLFRINGTITVHLYRGNDYDLFSYGDFEGTTIKAEKVALMLLFLDRSIFGERTFELIDKKLYNNYVPDSLKDSAKIIQYSQVGDNFWLTLCSPASKVAPPPTGCVTVSAQNGFEWPPDDDFPPIQTGGGQNPCSNCPTNCTGTGNCIIGTEIVNGVLPCGDCGSGPVIILPNITTISLNDTILNPCNDAVALQTSASFISYLQELKDSTNSNREYGYFMFQDNAGVFGNTQHGLIEGPENQLSLGNFTNGFILDCIAHSHFNTNTDTTRGLSVFSPDDLWTLCETFNAGNVRNPATFTMALVTKAGTQYLLKIENLTKFRIWAQKFIQGSLKGYYATFEEIRGINGNNSASDNETKFLQYLKINQGSGLKLFRGNSTFTQWTPIGLDATNNVVTVLCN